MVVVGGPPNFHAPSYQNLLAPSTDLLNLHPRHVPLRQRKAVPAVGWVALIGFPRWLAVGVPRSSGRQPSAPRFPLHNFLS